MNTVRAKSVIKMKTENTNMSMEYPKGVPVINICFDLLNFTGLEIEQVRKLINERIDLIVSKDK